MAHEFASGRGWQPAGVRAGGRQDVGPRASGLGSARVVRGAAAVLARSLVYRLVVVADRRVGYSFVREGWLAG